MRNQCGKIANILGSSLGKTSAWLSPYFHKSRGTTWFLRAQTTVVHTTLPLLSQLISPLKMAAPPLGEHYLYPVSTRPTNNYNQRKLKKGNK